MKIFAIIGEQRSGTTALGSALQQHSQVAMFGEVFIDVPTPYESFFDFWRSRIIDDGNAIYPKWTRVSSLLDEFVGSLQREGRPVVGLQIKYDHFRLVPHLEPWLWERKVDVIHIRRHNLVSTYLSQLSLEARAKVGLSAHTSKDDGKEPEISIEIPDRSRVYGDLKDMQERIAEGATRIRRLRKIEVRYEDLYGDHKQRDLRRIQAHLGIAEEPIDFGLKKSMTRPMTEVIKDPEKAEFMRRLLQDEAHFGRLALS